MIIRGDEGGVKSAKRGLANSLHSRSRFSRTSNDPISNLVGAGVRGIVGMFTEGPKGAYNLATTDYGVGVSKTPKDYGAPEDADLNPRLKNPALYGYKKPNMTSAIESGVYAMGRSIFDKGDKYSYKKATPRGVQGATTKRSFDPFAASRLETPNLRVNESESLSMINNAWDKYQGGKENNKNYRPLSQVFQESVSFDKDGNPIINDKEFNTFVKSLGNTEDASQILNYALVGWGRGLGAIAKIAGSAAEKAAGEGIITATGAATRAALKESTALIDPAAYMAGFGAGEGVGNEYGHPIIGSLVGGGVPGLVRGGAALGRAAGRFYNENGLLIPVPVGVGGIGGGNMLKVAREASAARNAAISTEVPESPAKVTNVPVLKGKTSNQKIKVLKETLQNPENQVITDTGEVGAFSGKTRAEDLYNYLIIQQRLSRRARDYPNSFEFNPTDRAKQIISDLEKGNKPVSDERKQQIFNEEINRNKREARRLIEQAKINFPDQFRQAYDQKGMVGVFDMFDLDHTQALAKNGRIEWSNVRLVPKTKHGTKGTGPLAGTGIRFIH